jgi:hypothetical protein
MPWSPSLQEIAAAFQDEGALRRLMTIEGELSAALSVYVEVLGVRHSFELASVPLLVIFIEDPNPLVDKNGDGGQTFVVFEDDVLDFRATDNGRKEEHEITR